MTQLSWHYQRGSEQIGPVSAVQLAEAYRSAEVTSDTMTWRDGMPEWVPMRDVMGELGITTNGPPPLGQHTPLTFRAKPAEVIPAGFVRRWLAAVIDSLLVSVVMMAMLVALAIPAGLLATDVDPAIPAYLALGWYAGYFVLAAMYFAGMESSAYQATLGKRALGIKVTDDEGRRLSFGHALGRWFSVALSYLTFYIGFLMAAVTERKRALHDMVSSTLVVDKYAYTEMPHLQKQGLSGCLVALVVGMLLFVPVVAIMSAITISQYQDYVIRSQVSEASSLVDGVKTAVGEYYANRESTFPVSNDAAGLASAGEIAGQYVSSVDVANEGGAILAEFSSSAPQQANAAIDGASLIFTPVPNGTTLSWQCHSSSIKQKHCPSSCECSAE